MFAKKDKYNETFETWNKVAQTYQDVFMNLDLYDDTYDIFCQEIKNEKASVLEIGCGPGNITRYVLQKCPKFMIQGIDVAPNMISLARKNNPQASFTVLDCRDIEVIKQKLDAVIAGFCFPYLSHEDGLIMIRRVSKMLNNNGVFYLSFIEGEKKNSGYQIGSTGDRTFFYYHEQKEIINQLRSNDFDVKHVISKLYTRSNGVNETHTIIIATTKS